MDIERAIAIIELIHGIKDETCAVGAAWKIVLEALENRRGVK